MPWSSGALGGSAPSHVGLVLLRLCASLCVHVYCYSGGEMFHHHTFVEKQDANRR